MSVLTDVISPQSGIISGIFGLGKDLIDRVIPDPAQKAEAQLKLLQLQQSGELVQLQSVTDLLKGQLEVDKIEAGSNDWFARDWRPGIGWACALAFTSNYVIAPFFTFFVNIYHGVQNPYPTLDMSTMMPVLLGLLGLGGLRTYDKYIGKANGS